MAETDDMAYGYARPLSVSRWPGLHPTPTALRGAAQFVATLLALEQTYRLACAGPTVSLYHLVIYGLLAQTEQRGHLRL